MFRLAEFWAFALGYTVGNLDQAQKYLDLIPPNATQPAVYFQLVPEAKLTKNRAHLDLYEANPVHLIEELRKRGASLIGQPRTELDGGWWQVMADPEGNEFCVCREHDDRLEINAKG